MRDHRFVAVHRGGLLSKSQHKQLIIWSCICVKHVMQLWEGKVDKRVQYALKVAQDWKLGNATVGEARSAAVAVISLARELSDPISIAITRASGHAVATAHMADHALGGAIFSLIALRHAGQTIDAEIKRQNDQLPSDIRDLVLSTRTAKEQGFVILRDVM